MVIGLIVYLWYSWYPFSPRASPSGTRNTDSASIKDSTSLMMASATTPKPPLSSVKTDGINSSKDNPPNWRDPERDFHAEYEQVLEAFPALRASQKARIAFLIMAHGPSDVMLLNRSFPWLYSPRNFFLVRAHTSIVTFELGIILPCLDVAKINTNFPANDAPVKHHSSNLRNRLEQSTPPNI